MEQNPTQERLDITKVKTVEELNSIDFSKYADKRFKSWVRHIVYPVSSEALDEICALSAKEGSMLYFCWAMGDLYYKNKVLPEIKPFKQMTLPGQI